MPIEGILEKGFVTTSLDSADQLGAQRLDVADDLRPGVLRGRDDARRRGALRPRPLRRRRSARARASPT